ncbi:exosortase Q [Ottowia sp. GY511]|uniref:Exosortase Q n=2 Tax=Ottowia flava TaxID=2675430 RepID=A0ABW4L1J9_9BURK|nr:exosortase Q [Ottowia sp. GY511]TXK28562.1 exosortase Q [Ottowia sp. GY511]
MSLPLMLRHPRLQPWSLRVDRAPALAWIALQTLALWPTWRWVAARLQDGSDDPLGVLALLALAALVAVLRRDLRCAPRLGWLMAAGVGTLAATLLRGAAPALVTSLVAVLAWAAGLLAFLPDARRGAMRAEGGVLWPAPRLAVGRLPVLGLAVLALPLIASLQFYAGYPLRVLTAEASRWLLAPWFAVVREGSSLNVGGVLVIVDAPCSGVQMAWAGYFTACAVALWAGRRDRDFALRLPLVGAAVLVGNVLRNSVLVALEAGPGAAPWLHEAVGLVALAAVCALIAWGMGRRPAIDRVCS